MKAMYKSLLAVAVLALVGSAFAAAPSTKPAKPATLTGTITKVDGVKVTVKAKDGDVVVVTDASTAVIIDKVEGKKVSDLQTGMTVKVTPPTGVATEIKAKTPAPAKGA